MVPVYEYVACLYVCCLIFLSCVPVVFFSVDSQAVFIHLNYFVSVKLFVYSSCPLDEFDIDKNLKSLISQTLQCLLKLCLRL